MLNNNQWRRFAVIHFKNQVVLSYYWLSLEPYLHTENSNADMYAESGRNNDRNHQLKSNR